MKYSVSSVFRYTYILILAILILSFITTQSLPIAGIVIAIVCLVALTYREEWVFDAELSEASYKMAFLMVRNAKVIPFSHIQYLDLRSRLLPLPFGRQRTQYYIILVDKQGDAYEIGSDKVRYSDKIVEDAGTLAAHCGVPLQETKL